MTSSVHIPYDIRFFNPSAAEYAEAAKVVSDAWPDYPISADYLKYIDEVNHPDLLQRRLVAEAEGQNSCGMRIPRIGKLIQTR